MLSFSAHVILHQIGVTRRPTERREEPQGGLQQPLRVRVGQPSALASLLLGKPVSLHRTRGRREARLGLSRESQARGDVMSRGCRYVTWMKQYHVFSR